MKNSNTKNKVITINQIDIKTGNSTEINPE